VRLGTAVPQAELTLSLDGAPRQIDTRRLRNLFTEVGGDPQRYLESLKAMANKE
jgi:hypothetical protein